MSVALPRAAANFIVHSKKARTLLNFLSRTIIPDESVWTSLGGNKAGETDRQSCNNGGKAQNCQYRDHSTLRIYCIWGIIGNWRGSIFIPWNMWAAILLPDTRSGGHSLGVTVSSFDSQGVLYLFFISHLSLNGVSKTISTLKLSLDFWPISFHFWAFYFIL